MINYGRIAAIKQNTYLTLLVLFITICCRIFIDFQIAISVALGGFIYIIPNIIFTIFAFAVIGATKAKLAVLNIYWGEFIKIILTIVLFSLVLKYYANALNIKVLFIVFGATLIMQLMSAPFFFKKITG